MTKIMDFFKKIKRYISEPSELEKSKIFNEKIINEFREFRKPYERFNYLGITMVHTGIWWVGYSIQPRFGAEYADKNGVIHERFFRYDELIMLKNENIG